MAPKINEETINQFISIFNTEIEKIADWINERIPVDSVLRKPAIKRALDFFSAWVEGRAKTISSPFVSAVVEKSSDLIEFISDRLDEENDGKSGKKEKTIGVVSGKSAEKIRIAFIGKITERLEKATDMEKEAEKIKKELQLFDEIIFGKKEEPVIATDKPKGKGFWESFNEVDRNTANWLRKFRGEKKGEWQ